MRIQATALNAKPSVSLSTATGSLVFKADDLRDAAYLTALYRCMRGGMTELDNALNSAAMAVAAEWKDGEAFEMRPPRKSK